MVRKFCLSVEQISDVLNFLVYHIWLGLILVGTVKWTIEWQLLQGVPRHWTPGKFG
jgi:hypothetical protein